MIAEFLYKRGNTWTVRVWIDGHKVERAVGSDRSVALAMQKELEAEITLNRAAGRSKAAYSIMKSRDKKTLFGHSDLETLFRHYARFIPSDHNGRMVASVGSRPKQHVQ